MHHHVLTTQDTTHCDLAARLSYTHATRLLVVMRTISPSLVPSAMVTYAMRLVLLSLRNKMILCVGTKPYGEEGFGGG